MAALTQQGDDAPPVGVGTVAGLLFAMHPVHTEAVSNIVCRAGATIDFTYAQSYSRVAFFCSRFSRMCEHAKVLHPASSSKLLCGLLCVVCTHSLLFIFL